MPIWFSGFLVVLALLPFPFGSNRLWASDLFGLGTGLLLIGLAVSLYRTPSPMPAQMPWRRLIVSALFFALVIAWAFIQTLNLPPFSHPLWQEAGKALGTSLKSSISIAPDRFAEAMIRMLAYAGCFVLALASGHNPARARMLLRVLALSAVAYALYGLIVHSTGNQTILWFDKWTYRDYLTSTFVNKNTYATYAGMGLLCCLSVIFQEIRRPLNLERFFRRDVFLWLAAFVVSSALVLTGSRGGIMSGVLGCLVWSVLIAFRRPLKDWRSAGLALAGVLFVFVFFLWDDRMASAQITHDSFLRITAYGTSLRALADYPWTGFGLGSFESVFRLYHDGAMPFWIDHAHNDYLEMAIEIGIPATLMELAIIAIMLSCCVENVWRRRKGASYSALALGASVIVGAHGLVDFSLQIPAVAATYAALLGLGVGACQGRSRLAMLRREDASLRS